MLFGSHILSPQSHLVPTLFSPHLLSPHTHLVPTALVLTHLVPKNLNFAVFHQINGVWRPLGLQNPLEMNTSNANSKTLFQVCKPQKWLILQTIGLLMVNFQRNAFAQSAL